MNIPTHPHSEFQSLRRDNAFLALQTGARRRRRRAIAIRTVQTVIGVLAAVGACFMIVTTTNPVTTLATVVLTLIAVGTLTPVVAAWVYRR